MAQALKARQVDMHLHYAGRSQQEMPFRDRLQREFTQAITIYSTADGERIDVEQVLAAAAGDAVIYVCGPARLIDAVVSTAAKLNMDATRIRFERFTANIDQNAKPIQLELRRSGKQLLVGTDQTILDAKGKVQIPGVVTKVLKRHHRD